MTTDYTHEYVETNDYTLSRLDETTWYLWDKTKRIPSPHYYKTLKAAQKKIKSILTRG